jgi:hypothetical protein
VRRLSRPGRPPAQRARSRVPPTTEALAPAAPVDVLPPRGNRDRVRPPSPVPVESVEGDITEFPRVILLPSTVPGSLEHTDPDSGEEIEEIFAPGDIHRPIIVDGSPPGPTDVSAYPLPASPLESGRRADKTGRTSIARPHGQLNRTARHHSRSGRGGALLEYLFFSAATQTVCCPYGAFKLGGQY